jgi:predicted PurR-regulated permease PerM
MPIRIAGAAMETNEASIPLSTLTGKLAVWAAFLVFLYLIRDFFFVAFMTLMISFATLTAVDAIMRRLSPNSERQGLRRLVTVGIFLFALLLCVIAGALVAPHVLEQGQRLAGWLSHVTPQTEVMRLLEGVVGPYDFRQKYAGPDDPAYQADLEEFRKANVAHTQEYQKFPSIEAWVEGGFKKRFADSERSRLRAKLAAEGTSSKDFQSWFLTVKYPELKKLSQSTETRPPSSLDPLIRASRDVSPAKALDQANRDPQALASLRDEWIHDAVEIQLTGLMQSPAYRKQFREAYDALQRKYPQSVPYTFDQYLTLQSARTEGPQQFGKAATNILTPKSNDAEGQLRSDFEAAKKHELFHEWWSASSAAQFIRRQVDATSVSFERVTGFLESFLNFPLDLATALLLSLFICIDYPNLKKAVSRLRETWLRPVYDEIAPALSDLGRLIGRSMQAQGLIALCNAILMGIGLTILGIEHEILLSFAVFILCLVPTLGSLIAFGLIAVVALLQPGGGVGLALQAAVLVAIVLCVETFVLSPRILGRMMELHPALIIAILPVAQYFFGVWGLILATPVTVYVIHVIILRRGLPGREASIEA